MTVFLIRVIRSYFRFLVCTVWNNHYFHSLCLVFIFLKLKTSCSRKTNGNNFHFRFSYENSSDQQYQSKMKAYEISELDPGDVWNQLKEHNSQLGRHTLSVRWRVSVHVGETSLIGNCFTAIMLSIIRTSLTGTVAVPSFFSFVDPRCHSCNSSVTMQRTQHSNNGSDGQIYSYLNLGRFPLYGKLAPVGHGHAHAGLDNFWLLAFISQWVTPLCQ